MRDKIKQYFLTLKKNSLLGTSYLFIGDDFALVKQIFKLINCRDSEYSCGICWDCKKLEESSHPDLLIIEPEGMTIKIEAIREAQKFLVFKNFRLLRKILVVKEGDKLSPEGANAFLKTLEEPPRNCFIAICVPKLEGVLPTIISRCRQIFLPFSQGNDADLSAISVVLGFLKGEKVIFKDRRNFISFLWTLILILRDYLIVLVSGKTNNRLLDNRECEIILQSYNLKQTSKILEETIKIYSVAGTINMNLGLNLIKINLYSS